MLLELRAIVRGPPDPLKRRPFGSARQRRARLEQRFQVAQDKAPAAAHVRDGTADDRAAAENSSVAGQVSLAASARHQKG